MNLPLFSSSIYIYTEILVSLNKNLCNISPRHLYLFSVISLQCLWRCYAAEPRSNFQATWRIHMQDTGGRHHGPNAFSKVARRASVIKKRRFSKAGRFDTAPMTNHVDRERKDSEASVMFLPEDTRNSGKYLLI